MAASDFYDDLETRDPEAREAANMAALAEQIANAQANSAWYAKSLGDVDPAAITSRQALAKLPVTRKHDLIELMKADPPMAGLNAVSLDEVALIFTSPGPIFELATDRIDGFGTARAFYAAGVRKGDIIHNSLSYHLTPGAWILHYGARALGCPVVPAGIGNTEQQAAVIAQIRPRVYAGTPDYLGIILEKGDELGLDLSSIELAVVGGGPLFPQQRAAYKERGIETYQTFATAELGNIAHETPALEGMTIGEDKIVEVLVPGTGEPVANAGDVGELVVTTLNPDTPLIRFATGDLTAALPGPSKCGRTNMRIKGWMGRADQTTKVRGMFVHPEQIAEVVKRHAEIGKARLTVDAVDGKDVPAFKVEVDGGGDALAGKIADTFQSVCKVRGNIELVAPGSLPNDGKVIDDVRKFD
ncbi:MAG TPA: phenylacetate--CoA ligase family protein [Alphaproteobacteria bacterium]|nr:phenylacetate--CoA ligase family protein [Alphaproteobacteria bacterium]